MFSWLDKKPRARTGAFCCAEYAFSNGAAIYKREDGLSDSSGNAIFELIHREQQGRSTATFTAGSGGWQERAAGLARVAVEDGLTGRSFDEMKDSQCEQDQDCVGEPGVQGGKVKALGHMVGVEELEDIEMEEVEAVTALADQEEGAPGEERGDVMRTAEAKD
jgi:hypothetical protein